MSCRCLLFDLDGTLVDSRADLVTAVNLMLGEFGLVRMGGERVVSFVGEGAAMLVGRVLAASGRGASASAKNYLPGYLES
jgi:phosphoglycolate phosphatase